MCGKYQKNWRVVFWKFAKLKGYKAYNLLYIVPHVKLVAFFG